MGRITQTSIDAYLNAPGKTTQRGKILRLLNMHPDGLTRNEISRMLKIRVHTVGARVVELINFGMAYEKNKDIFNGDDKYTRVDIETGMRNNIVYPAAPYT